MSALMPHWPSMSDLTTDCLMCAIQACDGSENYEDKAFAAACNEELAQRLYFARAELSVTGAVRQGVTA